MFGCGLVNSKPNVDYSNEVQYDIYQLATTDDNKYNVLFNISSLKGEKGDDGHTPVITIGENGNWFIDGVDTLKPAR